MKNGNFHIKNDHFSIGTTSFVLKTVIFFNEKWSFSYKNLISRNGHLVVKNGQLSGMSANRLMRNFEVI